MPRIFSGKLISIFSGRATLYLLLLLTLDITVTPLFRLGDNRIFLSYLMVVYAAFQWGGRTIIPMAVAVGVARDLVSTQSLGIETLSLVLTSALLYLRIQKIEREWWWLRILTAFLFILCVSVISMIMSSFLTGTLPNFWYYSSVALGSSIYTAVVTPVFFYLTARWFRDHVAFKQYELFH